MFEFYVLGENFNGEIEPFNVFNSRYVHEATLREVKKYLRAPSKYKFCDLNSIITGFDGFVSELDVIFKSQYWSRYEYEFHNCDKLDVYGVYEQLRPNINFIAREVICQYKEWRKNDGKDCSKEE